MRFEYHEITIYCNSDHCSDNRYVVRVLNNATKISQCLLWIDKEDGGYTLYRCYDEGKFNRVIETKDHGDGEKRSLIIGIDNI